MIAEEICLPLDGCRNSIKIINSINLPEPRGWTSKPSKFQPSEMPLRSTKNKAKFDFHWHQRRFNSLNSRMILLPQSQSCQGFALKTPTIPTPQGLHLPLAINFILRMKIKTQRFCINVGGRHGNFALPNNVFQILVNIFRLHEHKSFAMQVKHSSHRSHAHINFYNVKKFQ